MHARKITIRAMTASRSGQVQPGSRSQIVDPRLFDEDARIPAFRVLWPPSNIRRSNVMVPRVWLGNWEIRA